MLVRGTLVEGWRLEFREGRVVAASAVSGEAALRQLLATDDGAARLGEVALVPEASPTRATGVRFESTIFEENISCHVALGQVYASTIEGGGSMSADELASQGGNASSTHDDIMWGSSNVAVSGVRADGKLEPLLVGGEWGW